MRKTFKIAAGAAIVAAGCLAGLSESRPTEGSALTLENVEALSRWEVTTEYDKCCVEGLEYNCLPNYMGLIQGDPVPC